MTIYLDNYFKNYHFFFNLKICLFNYNYLGLTGGLAAPLVASGIGTITASSAFAGLATAAGSAIFGSIFGVAGGGLAGYKMKVIHLL